MITENEWSAQGDWLGKKIIKRVKLDSKTCQVESWIPKPAKFWELDRFWNPINKTRISMPGFDIQIKICVFYFRKKNSYEKKNQTKRCAFICRIQIYKNVKISKNVTWQVLESDIRFGTSWNIHFLNKIQLKHKILARFKWRP